ncbi:hypothetical protein GCM10027075_55580 [Streptomyces heilongjiangensis]
MKAPNRASTVCARPGSAAEKAAQVTAVCGAVDCAGGSGAGAGPEGCPEAAAGPGSETGAWPEDAVEADSGAMGGVGDAEGGVLRGMGRVLRGYPTTAVRLPRATDDSSLSGEALVRFCDLRNGCTLSSGNGPVPRGRRTVTSAS